MIHSFKNYLIEEDKVAYFTLGRLNPPTIGHEKLLDSLAKQAGRNDYFVFVTQSQDKKKNPLGYNEKVKHVRKMFPRHARRVMINKKIRTVFDAATFLYEKGYKSVVMVVGSDRVTEFQTLLGKYNGQKGQHGFYNFKSLDIASVQVEDAKMSLDVAQGRYDQQMIILLELLDAQDRYARSLTNQVRAFYDYKVAKRSQEKAMGVMQ